MSLLFKSLLLSLALWAVGGATDTTSIIKRLDALEKASKEKIKLLESTVSGLTRQLILQQLAMEEKIRGDGHSGLKRVRHRTEGTQAYHAETHVGTSQASLHDHSNLINTAGMGEFSAVLNGVEFRTRHNDYKLVMPHRSLHGGTKNGFHKTEAVPFPPVPPAVLRQANVSAQITELRQWFKAWRDGDHKTRDYRPYFRPLLCYLEGAWMADADAFDESFESDRHQLDASSWFDLQEKIRFTSYSGRKSNLENFAYLPTSVIGTLQRHNLTVPVYAQWNYRILCHPVRREVPLTLLRPVDDFSNRMAYRRRFADLWNLRSTRFQINPVNRTLFQDRPIKRGVLDDLMEEIPGKDNYRGYQKDDAFGMISTRLQDEEPINAAYYHRWFKVSKKGAMGLSLRHRGFSDENLFAAMTNSTKVAPMTIADCEGRGKDRKCTNYTQRWTWAVPLEVIYLTPLQRWDPYGTKYYEDKRLTYSVVQGQGRRTGKLTPEGAYNGTARKFYFRTPAEFFQEAKGGKEDKADTGAKGKVGVLDTRGNVRAMKASGVYAVLPPIDGLGRLRTRFPVFPVHEEGGTAYKEAAALREFIMEKDSYANLARHDKGKNGTTDEMRWLRLESQGSHCHEVMVSAFQMADMKQGRTVEVQSEEANGHTHFLTLYYHKKTNKFRYRLCDKKKKCGDGHSPWLAVIEAGDSCD